MEETGEQDYWFIVNAEGVILGVEWTPGEAEEGRLFYEETDPHHGPYEVRKGRVVLEG